MDICRLIYRSTTTDAAIGNDDLRDILDKAASNNRDLGITGLLLLSGDQFLQVLEGPSRPVNALFQKICRDPRHHTIELMQYEPSTECYFQDWSMRLVDLFDLPLEQRGILMRKYRCEEGAVLIPDQMQLVFSLLLDAKAICLGEPWAGS